MSASRCLFLFLFFSSRRRHTRFKCDWSSDVCSSDLGRPIAEMKREQGEGSALFKLIRQHGLVREFPLIVSTLKAFGQGEVKIESGRVFSCQGKPISGYDLSDEENKAAGF